MPHGADFSAVDPLVLGAERRALPASWRDWLAERLGRTRAGMRACQWVLGGCLAGWFLFYNDAMRVLWLLLAGTAALLLVDWPRAWQAARADALRLVAAHFLCWMTARSLLAYGMTDGASGFVAAGWLLGTLMLAVFSVVVWQAAQDADGLEALGFGTGLVAAAAAVLSAALTWLVLPGHVFGERLMNVFVYGGWNPVSTGLTFGFAAVWLACLRGRLPQGRKRALANAALAVLLVAVCFTRSRGALLAVTAGLAVLAVTRGLRHAAFHGALLGLAVVLFSASGPVVRQVTAWQAEKRALPASVVIQEPPVREMVRRWDAGRFDLYQRALQSITGLERWFFGIGQWGPEEACCRSLSRLHHHLHSGFFATFIHGGLLGLGLLLGVLGIGLRRAAALAREGRDTWLVLLVYGCTGLLFDGQTFTSFTSIPQMETLLVAFPLTAAAAVWWAEHKAGLTAQ